MIPEADLLVQQVTYVWLRLLMAEANLKLNHFSRKPCLLPNLITTRYRRPTQARHLRIAMGVV